MADYWIKLYHEIIEDPKIATLPDRLWRRIVELFLLAGRLCPDKSGVLPETRQLAWLLRMSTDDLDLDMRQIESVGIIQSVPGGWLIVNFKKRQSAVAPAERMRQSRQRAQKHQYYGDATEPVTLISQSSGDNVTNELRNVTQINRLTETETEAEQKSATAAFSPSNSSSIAAEKIFQTVTGMITFPSSEREDAIGAIESVISHERDPIAYLRPFYDEFKKRYPRSTRCFWLTDWAVTGSIPGKREPPPQPKKREYTTPDGEKVYL